MWLVLPPLLVFAAGDVLQGFVGWSAEMPAPTVEGEIWIRDEASARLTMMAAFLAAISVGLGVILLFAIDLARLFGRRARRRLLAAASVAVLALVAWVLLIGSFLQPIEDYLGRGFLAGALVEPSSRAGANAPPLLESLRWLNWILRVILLLGATAVILGAISCLAEPNRNRPPWARQALCRMQMRRLRRYVNAAGALMAIGLLYMIAWMRWPAFVFTGDAAAHAAYLGHVNALAIYFGIYYSVVIASYFLPIAAILRQREAGLLLGPDVAAQGGSLIDKRSADVAAKGFAVLAPALAGVLPSLLDLLQGSAT